MYLQLFQLTCKCGHLHLRRKRKEEIEGGRESRERRGATAKPGTKPRPSTVGTTLLPLTRQAQIQNQKKLLKNKGPFLPQTQATKKSTLSKAFILEHSAFYIWGYYLLHCRPVQQAGIPYKFKLPNIYTVYNFSTPFSKDLACIIKKK